MKILFTTFLFLFSACTSPMGDDGCQELEKYQQEQIELKNSIDTLSTNMNLCTDSISKLEQINNEQELIINKYDSTLVEYKNYKDSLQSSLTNKIILPREHAEALFIDAQKLPIVLEEIIIKDSIILSNNQTIVWQDSTIKLLKKQIALQDSMFNELKLADSVKDNWYTKYLYAIIAFLSGTGLSSIVN